MPIEDTELKSMFQQLLDIAKLSKRGHKVDFDDDDDDDEYNDGKGKVPVSEMRRSSRQRKKAERRAEEAEARLEEFQSTIPDIVSSLEARFSTQLEELKAQSASAVNEVKLNFDRKQAFEQYGIEDDHGRAAALAAYNALPEAGRLALPEQLEAWKAKPEDRPKTLDAYLGEGGSKREIPNTSKGAKDAKSVEVDVNKMSPAELDAFIASYDS